MHTTVQLNVSGKVDVIVHHEWRDNTYPDITASSYARLKALCKKRAKKLRSDWYWRQKERVDWWLFREE